MSEVPSIAAHNLFEDAAALISGSLIVALGVTLHAHAQILTGGTSGLALMAQYGLGMPFALGFFLINIPFYGLAALRLGWKLTLRTVVAVCLVSLFAKFTPEWLVVGQMSPAYSAVIGGLLIGVGLLILFRHRFSLGGINLVALFAQERLGWNAGLVQLSIDAAIILASLLILPPERAALSFLAAVVLNLVLAVNHKPERYLGRS